MEDFCCFDDFLFSFEVPSISPKAHMYIHSPEFYDTTLLQTDLLPIIFDTSAILFISMYKIYFVVPINNLPESRTLRGMGYGTPISGIGIVQWRFNTGETTLTIQGERITLVPNIEGINGSSTSTEQLLRSLKKSASVGNVVAVRLDG